MKGPDTDDLEVTLDARRVRRGLWVSTKHLAIAAGLVTVVVPVYSLVAAVIRKADQVDDNANAIKVVKIEQVDMKKMQRKALNIARANCIKLYGSATECTGED